MSKPSLASHLSPGWKLRNLKKSRTTKYPKPTKENLKRYLGGMQNDDNRKRRVAPSKEQENQRKKRETQFTKNLAKRIKTFNKKIADAKQGSVSFELEDNSMSRISKALQRLNISGVPAHMYLTLGMWTENNTGQRANKYFTITNQTVGQVLNRIRDQLEIDEEKLDDHYNGLIDDLRAATKISFQLESRTVVRDRAIRALRRNRGGRFFGHYLAVDLDLKKYGIFQSYEQSLDEKKETAMSKNCFLNAVQENFPDSTMVALAQFIRNGSMPKKNLERVAQLLNSKITLKTYDPDHKGPNKVRKKKYGQKLAKPDHHLKLACIGDHYFVNERTQITKFFLKNYDELKDLENPTTIFRRRKNRKTPYKRSKKEGMKSAELVIYLLKHSEKFLKPIPYEDLMKIDRKMTYEEKSRKRIILDPVAENRYIAEHLKPFIYEPREYGTIRDFDLLYAADFEADPNGVHVPYAVCMTRVDHQDNFKLEKTLRYFGDETVKSFLEKVRKDVKAVEVPKDKKARAIIYFHNLSYDVQFLMKYKDFRVLSDPVKSGNKPIQINASYKGVNLLIRDSYCMITAALKKFPKMFKLKDIKKEVMPYTAYNKKSLTMPLASVEGFCEHLKTEKEKEQFRKNIDELGLRHKDFPALFDHKAYALFYCEQDVDILVRGILVFREGLKELDMELFDSITISAIAQKYMEMKGCYNGTYELKGAVREFVQLCNVGGRCMTADNKVYHVKRKTHALDSVSLYPSAGVRLGKEYGGFLLGKPTVFNDKSYEWLCENTDGFFVEIEVFNIFEIRRKFPAVSKYENNARNWTNDVRGYLHVGMITIEEMIKYHGVVPGRDFKVIQGVYFDSGRNHLCKKAIQDIFDRRLEAKKDKNPLQQLLKLMLNSIYGKTITKAVDSETKFIYSKHDKKSNTTVSAEQLVKEYQIRNEAFILETIEVIPGECYEVKTAKATFEHSSRPHIGCEFLEMSKRIMNELIYLAEDLGIDVYYTDTDSIHLDIDRIPELDAAFQKKFKRPLQGIKMGQFHFDIDSKTLDDGTEVEAEHITESYFVAKKCYMERVLYADGSIGFNSSMKGIPKDMVEGEEGWEIYKDLYEGKRVSFDITKNRPKFEIRKDHSIATRADFIRNLQFPVHGRQIVMD